MRRLIAKGIILLAIASLLLGFANSYYSKHILNKDAYFSTLNEILQERPKFLILGDSHAEAAFRSNVDKNSFGVAAAGSDSLMDSYLKLKYLIERGYTPEFLLLEADATVFASYRWSTNNRRYSFFLAEASLINELYKSSYSDIEVILYSWVPILDGSARQITFRFFVEKIYRKTTSDDASSISWEFLSSKEREEQVLKRVADQFASSGFNNDLARIFVKIVDLANSNGIEVIGIRYPLTEEYLNALDGEIEIYTNSLLISEGIHNLDFSRVFIGESHLFVNSDHLNVLGSEEFISLLCNEL